MNPYILAAPVYSLALMRSEVLTAVKMLMLVFWVVTLCVIVGRYQRFGGTRCLRNVGITGKSTRRYNREDQYRQLL
jgi:hypothetical protein